MNGEIPIQKVLDYRQQGLSTEKIIQSLISEGYSMQIVRDALQQAEIKKSIATNIAEPAQEEAPSIPQPQHISKPAPAPQPAYASAQPRQQGINIDEIQRILEEIISEKWAENEEVIRNMIEWKAVISTKIKEMETRMAEFNIRVDNMNSMLGKKAEEFNSTMTDVDTEIKALDKALNKLIPALSDNISELKDIINRTPKEEKTSETKKAIK